MKAFLLLALLLTTTLANDELQLWTFYYGFTNTGIMSQTGTITFTDEVIVPESYDVTCNLYGIEGYGSTGGINFNCDCSKLQSAVACMITTGSSLTWTQLVVNVAISKRDDTRLGTFSRILTPPFNGAMQEIINPWVTGETNNSMVMSKIWIRGVDSSENNFTMTASNPSFDIASHTFSFNFVMTNHTAITATTEVHFSYLVIEPGNGIAAEEDLDLNVFEEEEEEIQGSFEIQPLVSSSSGNLRAHATSTGFGVIYAQGFSPTYTSQFPNVGMLFKINTYATGGARSSQGCNRIAKRVERPLSQSAQVNAIAKMSPEKKYRTRVVMIQAVCQDDTPNNENQGNDVNNPFGLH